MSSLTVTVVGAEISQVLLMFGFVAEICYAPIAKVYTVELLPSI